MKSFFDFTTEVVSQGHVAIVMSTMDNNAIEAIVDPLTQ